TLAAAAREVESGVECPDVASHDADIDLAVVEGDGLDRGIVEIRVAAQDARGLIEQVPGIALAGMEEELITDRPLAGHRMQAVGKAEEPVVVRGVAQVEYVLVVDLDVPDERAPALELRVRRDGRGADLLAGMRRRSDLGRREEQQRGQERREGVRPHGPENTATARVAGCGASWYR